MPIIAPSILNADFLNLGDTIEMINKSDAEWIHLDVMDGSFVPNISFGIPIVEAVRKITSKPLDVHLMIVNPEKYIEPFRKAGADVINVHYEACKDKDLRGILQDIKKTGVKAAITINPDTPVEKIFDFVDLVDMVLIMSVFPGFGGQKFIEDTYDRIRTLKGYLTKNKLESLIEIDGGVSTDNAQQLFQAGADVLVVGSFIFRSDDPIEVISNLMSKAS